MYALPGLATKMTEMTINSLKIHWGEMDFVFKFHLKKITRLATDMAVND